MFSKIFKVLLKNFAGKGIVSTFVSVKLIDNFHVNTVG